MMQESVSCQSPRLICLCLLLSLLISSSSAEVSTPLQYNDETSLDWSKRVPSGFMGMRGKKASTPYISELYMDEGLQIPEYYQELPTEEEEELYSNSAARDKKVPRGFLGMRGKKVPSGFLGLRGKKDVPKNLNDLILALSNRYRNNYGYKRAPLGFLGLRGRRGGYGEEEQVMQGEAMPPKRVPLGFMGVRG